MVGFDIGFGLDVLVVLKVRYMRLDPEGESFGVWCVCLVVRS